MNGRGGDKSALAVSSHRVHHCGRVLAEVDVGRHEQRRPRRHAEDEQDHEQVAPAFVTCPSRLVRRAPRPQGSSGSAARIGRRRRRRSGPHPRRRTNCRSGGWRCPGTPRSTDCSGTWRNRSLARDGMVTALGVVLKRRRSATNTRRYPHLRDCSLKTRGRSFPPEVAVATNTTADYDSVSADGDRCSSSAPYVRHDAVGGVGTARTGEAAGSSASRRYRPDGAGRRRYAIWFVVLRPGRR